jgi:DNA-binding transcriptional LysR family regulator
MARIRKEEVLDLNALRVFVEIVDAGNMSAAARKLKTTRSNISYRLRLLEEALGVQLLRRTTRQLEPTHIGAGLYEHGLNILREASAAAALVSSAGKSLQGHVRLSVPTGLGNILLPELLIQFKRDNPDISLDVIFDNRVANLVSENIDIAIRVISTPPDAVIAIKLADVEWIVCATPSYLDKGTVPTSVKDLAEHALICSAAIGQRLRVSSNLAGQFERVELEPSVRSENFLFLKEAVIGGVGIGVLPHYAIREEIKAGNITRLFPEHRISVFGSKLYLLTMPSRFQTMATKELISFLKRNLSESSSSKGGAQRVE